MKNLNKLFLVTSLILILFITINGVCATDITNNNNTVSINDSNNMISDSVSNNDSVNLGDSNIQISENKNIKNNSNNINEVSQNSITNDEKENTNLNLISSTSNYVTYKELNSYLNYQGKKDKFTLYYDVNYTDTDFTPFIPIDWNITINGEGHTIDGNFRGQNFIIGCNESDNAKHINVVFMNINFINANGGAITIESDTTVTFINCTFENNYRADKGGAICISNKDYKTSNYTPKVNIQSCTFMSNRAISFGGAIYNTGTLNITSSKFYNNDAGLFGGAIYNFNESSMIIESSIFEDNVAKYGGEAIYNVNNYNISTIINNCNFDHNGVTTYNRYTISNEGGLIQVTNSIINLNHGGGLENIALNNENSKLILKNTNITSNEGPAIYNGNSYTMLATTDIEQCIITDNNKGIINSATYLNLINKSIVNAHYNIICNNNGKDVINEENNINNSNIFAQYNWWGSNEGAINISGLNINTTYPVQLTLSPSEGSTINTNLSTFTVYLNYYKDNYNLIKLNESIPTHKVYYYTNNSYGSLSVYFSFLHDSDTVTYNANNYPATISVKADNQISKLYINPSTNITTKTTVTLDKFTYKPNEWVTASVKVYDNSNNYVMEGELLLYVNGILTGRVTLSSPGMTFGWNSTLTEGSYVVKAVYIGVSGKYSNSTGITILNVTSDNNTNITISSTKLSADNFVETYGQGKNFTAKLQDSNGNPIVGQHISIKLSRSNGQSKTYWTTTDTDGYALLQINLSPGSYNAEVTYSGSNKYNASTVNSTITVTNPSENRTGVVLTANKFNQPYGAGANFTGTLKDTSGNLLIGQHVAVNLTRLSNGLSKVYWVTTDTDGAFQLQINLGLGEYTAQCSYGGTTKYQPASAGNTISVTNP